MFANSKNIVVTGGAFTVENEANDAAFAELQKKTVPAALHDYGERFSPPRCHDNTRLDVLKEINNWIDDPVSSDVDGPAAMWMKGSAGVGKSAIAQTIAEQRASEKSLLATFFFSRFDASRDNHLSLVATIAYQAALNIPEILCDIKNAIKHDPIIFQRSLERQFSALVIHPLQRIFHATGCHNRAAAPRLIILDGLDECKDSESQTHLLQIISEVLLQSRLPIRILISSRPEQHLTAAFGSTNFKECVAMRHLDLSEFFSGEDIRIFLKDKFKEIRTTHPLRAQIRSGWPSSINLERLITKASGQFIYATTVVKYVESKRHPPPARLDIVLGVRSPKKTSDSPFSALDALYTNIFSSVEDPDTVLDVLCMVLSYHYFRPVMADRLLSLEEGESELLLRDLASVLTINDQAWWMWMNMVRVTHASLDDFLRDPSRSKELYLDTPQRHSRLAKLCISVIIERASGEYVLHRYAFTSLPAHLRLCTPLTPDIRADILNVTFPDLFNDPRQTSCDMVKWIIIFLNSTKDKDSEFHRLHLQVFEEYVLSQLDLYYSDPSLTFIVAVLYMIFDGVPVEDIHWVIDHWRFRYKSSNEVDGTSLKMIEAISRCVKEYLQLIYDILEDPKNREKYGINTERYTIGALACLKHVYFPELYKTETQEKGREKMRCDILPYLLEKSAWSEEIASFIHSNAAAKLLIQELVSSGQVKNGAVSRYL